MNKGIYFGRFQPMHLAHLQKVRQILGNFENLELTIGIADWKGVPNKNNFLSGSEAVAIARLSLDEAGLYSVKACPVGLNPEKSLKETIKTVFDKEYFNYVFSGSDKTLEACRSLLDNGYNMNIVDLLDNGEGVRATDLREWMLTGEATWKNFISPRAVEFISNPELNLIQRLSDLEDGEKRPWSLNGEIAQFGLNPERR